MNSPGMNFKQDTLLHPNVIEGRFNPYRVKALVPMRANGQAVSIVNERLSRKSLALVLLAHILVFAALISAQSTKPPIDAPIKPMLVSFVSNPAPEPEVVPFVPPPPKPEPVIQKKPKPVVKERIPEPQPEVVEQPVVSEQPPVISKPAPVAEELSEPQPIAESKIEPLRAQINPLESPAPNYPAQSRRMGEEGRVVLRILVSEKGNAETVQIETSSGFERLDQSALETVKKKWRFIPAKRNNQPVSAYAIVPIKFSLEN